MFKQKLLCVGVAVAALTACQAQTDFTKTNTWYDAGEASVEQAKLQQDNVTKAKNVILFVGDGMGISTVTAARIFAGQKLGLQGEEHRLSFEKFPFSGMAKTYNTNQQTPDSAGTMTAMMAGVKSKAGVIGVADGVVRADCSSVAGQELTSALMLAEDKGLATGVVSTARITHATPAATYAVSPERNFEDNSKTTECGDIAKQLIEFPYGDGIEVALGGGLRHFLPKSEGGKRINDSNLIDQWNAKNATAFVETASELSDFVSSNSSDKLLGLFSSSHMAYEADRGETEQPSIAQMTRNAIDVLSRDEDGFFLMVEGGRIDHAHHAGNAYRAMEDTLAFADAIDAAVKHNKINLDETLIIVTADHSHVFTLAGYPTRGNPILGKVVGNDSAGHSTRTEALAQDDMPYTTVGYMNGRGFAYLEQGGDARYGVDIDAGRKNIEGVNTQGQGYHQESLIPSSSETHAGEDVGIWAMGPWAHLFGGTLEQHMIFHVMDKAAGYSEE